MLKMLSSLHFVTLLCIILNVVIGKTVISDSLRNSHPVCQGTRRIGTIPAKGGAMTVTQFGSSYFKSGGDCYCLPVLGGGVADADLVWPVPYLEDPVRHAKNQIPKDGNEFLEMDRKLMDSHAYVGSGDPEAMAIK
ncbi:uncharacterized protein MELLADRAFT_106541 [Melampsora larici-populina 98AG31]|uniref:Secreted protein n=1 Tax=Melampsora larici-populina (strain 98AG31 / pathotype 3-4-7) TaxID=747676 RepID=F4RLU5_MELLP|nr:uncharacterized protein MELLADRAFT_106541 [Melampsora larici-populina 98AG31]EGG06696.1 hypothetical protein MELLADRAFT_106541 [Melampsora larici-populina 98AG31]